MLTKNRKDLGPYIAVLKTHIDVVQDFSIETVHGLKSLAKKHNFLIFEDRKFVDIGNTVQKQYHGGALRISEFAHIVDLSILGGEGIVEALSQTISVSDFPYRDERAFILLADMTSKGSLATGIYTSKCVELARVHEKIVIGFIAMRTLTTISVDSSPSDSEDFFIFITDVNQKSKNDKLDQQYQTPTDAIRGGANFIIVGRDIYVANNPVHAAQLYQKED